MRSPMVLKAFGRARRIFRVVISASGCLSRAEEVKIGCMANRLMPVQLLQKTLNVNTTSMEVTTILFKDAPSRRVNDSSKGISAYGCLESNSRKMNTLFQRGVDSFANHEDSSSRRSGIPRPGAVMAIPERQLETWVTSPSRLPVPRIRPSGRRSVAPGAAYAGKRPDVSCRAPYGNDTTSMPRAMSMW